MNLTTKSGKKVHPIGIGTWDIGSIRTDAGEVKPVLEDNEKGIEAIRYSVSKGQNHIDTAELYGAEHTEKVVGKAIQGLKREDLYIASKLWKTHVAKGTVKPAVEAMLERLGTDYLDLLYIHAPWEDAPWEEAIPQIDELIDQGIVSGFGVSNFKISHMKKAISLSRHSVLANQLHFNVMHKRDATKTVREFCKDNNIEIVSYRPLERKAVEENETVLQIAQKNNVSPAQVALAWLRQIGVYSIPKATSKAHIDENLASMELTLSDEAMQLLE